MFLSARSFTCLHAIERSASRILRAPRPGIRQPSGTWWLLGLCALLGTQTACQTTSAVAPSATLLRLPEAQLPTLCLGDLPEKTLFQEGEKLTRVLILPLRSGDFASSASQSRTRLEVLLSQLELPADGASNPPQMQVLNLPCTISSHQQARTLGQNLGADLVVWGAAAEGAAESSSFMPRLTLLERVRKLRDEGSSRWAWGEVLELDLAALGSAEPRWLAQFIMGLHFYRNDQGATAVPYIEAAIQTARENGLHQGLHPLYAALGWNQLLADNPLAAQAALRMSEEEARAAGALAWELLSLRAQADIASLRGDLGEARRMYDAALERYQGAGTLKGIADCQMGLADVQVQIGDTAEARRYLKEALTLYEGLNLGDRAAGALRNLGDVAMWTNDYATAESQFQHANTLYRELNVPSGEALTTQRIGDVRLWLSDVPGARLRYEQARAIYQTREDKTSEAGCLMSLGNADRVGSQYSEARINYEQAIKLFQQSGDELGQANGLRALADVLSLGTSYDDARFAYEQAIALYKARGSLTGEAACLRGLAYLERSFGVGYAKRQYETALHLSHKAGDKIGEAHSRLGLGQLAVSRTDYQEARTNFERGRALYLEAGYSLGEALTLQGLGESSWGLNDGAAARVYYEQALQVYQGAGLKQGEMQCFLSMGQAAMRSNELKDAQRAYGEAARVARSIKDRQGEADALFLTGRLLVRMGKGKESISILEQSREMYRSLGVVRNLAISTADLGTVLLTLNEAERGKSMLEEATALFEKIGMNGEAESCRSLIVVPPSLGDGPVGNR